MHNNDLEPITPEKAVEMYLADKENELAQATHYSHTSRLGHFVRWADEQDIENLNNLTGRDLHEYRIWRRNDGDLSVVSEKTQMDTIRVWISWCESIDAVPKDLSTKVRSPSLSNGDNVRDEMVSRQQARDILEYLRTYEYASARHATFYLLWHCALRRGSLVALDLRDYSPDEQYLEVRHRPDQGTPIKNQDNGERMIALSDDVCEVLDAWIADRRPDVTDEFDRNPLITTKQGRVHPGTVQSWVYSLTRPCFLTDECSYNRDLDACKAAQDRTVSYDCPGSLSTHTVRRGALTHWLSSDLPDSVITSRGNVTEQILTEHYDRRSEKQRMSQRRKYLGNID